MRQTELWASVKVRVRAKNVWLNGSRDVGKYLGKLREAPFLLIVSTAVSPAVQMLIGTGQQMTM